MNPIPWTGSPPMPTQVDWPIPRWVSSCTIWYVRVPERDTSPTRPGRQISAGMIPTFDFPGEIRPGQFGPTSVGPRPSMWAATRAMSATGMPSVTHTTRSTPESAASRMASAANRAGT